MCCRALLWGSHSMCSLLPHRYDNWVDLWRALPLPFLTLFELVLPKEGQACTPICLHWNIKGQQPWGVLHEMQFFRRPVFCITRRAGALTSGP